MCIRDSSGTLLTLGDYNDYEDKSAAINLPFNFQFYGESFARATICSNGWIAMGDTYLVDYRNWTCLLYTSPSPRDRTRSRMPSSA